MEEFGGIGAAILIELKGERIELDGEGVRAWIDPDTITVEGVTGGKRAVQEVEAVLSAADHPAEPKQNAKAVIRGTVLRVAGVDPEPGLWRVTFQRRRA